MAKVYIDNKEYEVPEGKNMLEVCLSLGLDLTYFCWHPAMDSVGRTGTVTCLPPLTRIALCDMVFL